MVYLTVAFSEVVQVYETCYVTHLLNPRPREEDLLSLSLKYFKLNCLLAVVFAFALFEVVHFLFFSNVQK